ncbi:energy transducer TonB [Zavarzinia compransoris]|uniref:Protein TonB n=1 Tax=Zavarzinia compransoris TaxID=1264899 RepID=A0A317E6K9_9PROT|nr:energy transducer TonB [Zavarzinia compransoris]PWR21866.1 hypothetical protein DKG75_07740 [Zavarzinia compransoris]TDP45328.1 outer membrane transport energization protein TonB [Zavarzinia compransoris]
MSENNRPVFLGVSVAGHALAIAGLIYLGHAQTSGAMAPAPPTIELLLPPALPAAAAVPVEATEVKPVEAVETPPEIQEAVEPEPPPPLPVMAEAVEAIEETPVLVAKAPEPEKPKPPKPKPPPREVQKPKKPEKPREEPAAAPAAAPAPPSNAPPGPAPSAATAAAPVSGGGNPGARQDYRALVSAWIEKHKRYPDSARRRGIEGKPTVRFRIDRGGHVQMVEIHRETGRRDLDEAALRTIERADPFPPFPDDIEGQSMEFVVPIDFNMKR